MQLKAILNPLGWTIAAQDRRGDAIGLTVEMNADTLAKEIEKLNKPTMQG